MLVADADEAGTGEASGKIREEGGEVMAANSIKGITIEIGGDTTKLDKALSETGKKSASLQRELKEVNRLLKLDPGNTELVAQKQKILAESVSETKKKLDILKEAEKQVQEQFERGEVSEEQYRALQREIIKTEADLKSLNEEAAKMKWQGVADAGKKIEEAGNKISGVGQKLLPVTAAVSGLGTAAVAAAMDIDNGYDIIITKTGATGEALEELTDAMDNVFADLPTDAETAGIAIGEVNTRFGLTGKECEKLSKQFIRFAEINGTDLNSSIDSVDAIMTKFGVDTSQTEKVLGLMTKAGQDTGLSMEDLYRALETNGATLKEMGLDLTSSVNLLAQFESSGVDASTALAGLKKAQQNATAEGKTLDEALGETITKIKDAGSETEALQIATELFGKKGAAEMTQAIREGRFSLEDLTGSLDNYASTVEDTFNATLDPWDQSKIVMNNVKVAGKELAETMIGAVQPMITKMVDKVKEFTQWFKNLSEEQKQQIIKIAAIVAAIGPLLVTGGKAVSLVGKLTSTFASLGAKLTAASANAAAAGTSLGAIAAPVAAVVAIVAALVAAFVHLWRTNEDFRNKIISIWNGIKEKFNSFAQGIVDRLNALGFDFENITDVIRALWEGLCKFLAPVFEGVFQQIANIFSFVLDVITGILDVFIGLFTGNWDQMLQGVKEIFGAAWEFVKNTFQNYVNILKNILNVVCEFFGTTWADAWEGIKQTFVNAWQAVKNGVSEVGSFIGNAFTAAYNAVISVFKGIGQWFADRWRDIQNALSTVATWFQTMFQNAYTNVTNIFKAIGQWFAARWQDIKNALSTVATWFQTMFQNAYTNLTNVFKGIGQWFSARYTDIKNAISGIPEFFRSTFQSAFDKITGVFKGIGSWFKTNVIDAIKGVFDNFNFKQIGENIINAIKNGIKSISLPKLSIEWGTSEKTIAGVTIKVPVPHISWNAAGGIMQNPTIFGMYGGKLQGGGEAGPEAILPLDTFYERVEGYINEAAEKAAQAAAEGGSRAAGGRGGDFYQYNSYTSPKALSPSEAARQTRNATRNMVLQLQRGRG